MNTSLPPTSLPTTWLLSTGGGELARALAEAVLGSGGRLVLAAASPADLAEFSGLAGGDRLRLAALDGADPGSAGSAVHAAVEAFGRLDVVVSAPSEVLGSPDAAVDGVRARLDAELLGTVALTSEALDVFRRQGSGAFLHVAPPATPARAAGSAAAVVVRRAVEGWFEALHEEAAPLGVPVTVAQPGAVPGDPERMARVLVDVATMEHPPSRLALGSDALRRAQQSARGRVQELDVWADVSRSTDLPGAPVRSLDRGLASVLHLAVPVAS